MLADLRFKLLEGRPGIYLHYSVINCNDLGNEQGQEITHDALRADSPEQPLPIFVIRHTEETGALI
jgi:hypothetical protein